MDDSESYPRSPYFQKLASGGFVEAITETKEENVEDTLVVPRIEKNASTPSGGNSQNFGFSPPLSNKE